MENLQSSTHSVAYGQRHINYSLFYSARCTLEIAVHPDGVVIVKAPIDVEISLIEKKIKKRARWVIRQLNYFRQFTPRTPERSYINGETHLYLGKQYRLKSIQGNKNSVKLTRGFFLVSCREQPAPGITKKLLQKWYAQKAVLQFNDSFNRCWPKFKSHEIVKPALSIKKMQKRWGSLSKKGVVTLNTDLVKAPKECIDYVVTHELCHLIHHNHSPEFYKLLESAIPQWEEIKHKLELSLI